MTAPLASIIIPAFNAEKTITRALQSIFAQTANDYEVIVIDDGSTDNLEATLHAFKDRIIFRRQENRGAAGARNHGASIARGKFLAFLDADDFWHPRKLELQINAFKTYPELAFCASQCKVFDASTPTHTDHLELTAEPEVKRIDDFSMVFLNPYFGTPGIVMPKQVFNRHGGFKEHLKTAEDVDLWLRASYQSPVACILAPLFYIVRLPNSLTASFTDQTYVDNIAVIDLFCKEHPEFHKTNKKVVRSALARVYEDWGSSALTRGDKLLARNKLRHSLRNRLSPRASYLLAKTFLP